MNRDDVIRWARQADQGHAGSEIELFGGGVVSVSTLQRFADMVAAAERRKHQADIEHWKAQAAQAEKWRGMAHARHGDGQKVVQEIQREAREREREACANLCEMLAAEVDKYPSECAASIRARGQ